MIAMGPDSHHPLVQQFSLGVQQQFGSNWVISADGLYVFADRQLNGHLLRTTNSTSPYVQCPGNNVPCSLTDPLNGISDNITILESRAKSWYGGLLFSLEHRQSKLGPLATSTTSAIRSRRRSTTPMTINSPTTTLTNR